MLLSETFQFLYFLDCTTTLYRLKKIYGKVYNAFMVIVSQSEEALPINIFLCKVSNRNTRKWCELCSELT